MTTAAHYSLAEQLIATFTTLRIEYIAVVPCSGVDALYAHYARLDRCVFATREEEAVEIAAGFAIAGTPAAVVMQQSGVGNALNAVFTLADAYDIYFPIIVLVRGAHDVNPVQRVSSNSTLAVLTSLGAIAVVRGSPTMASEVAAAVRRRERWVVVLDEEQ